jgi:hypothetical protein
MASSMNDANPHNPLHVSKMSPIHERSIIEYIDGTQQIIAHKPDAFNFTRSPYPASRMSH